MKKYFFLAFVCTILLGGIVAVPVLAQYGLDETASAAQLPGEKNLPVVVGNVVGTALSMVAVLFFGLMIYGGILWMTARGNGDQTQKAFDTITAAVIGIAIVMASYAITSFAFKTVQGSPVQSPEDTRPTCTVDSDAVCRNQAAGSDCAIGDDPAAGECLGLGASLVCSCEPK